MSETSVTDIPADSAPATTDVLASHLQLIRKYMLVRCMLVEYNCNHHACCSIAEFKRDLSAAAASRPASLVKL